MCPMVERPDLRAELLRRMERDQAARKAHDDAAAGRADADNLPWLKKVISEIGWPGRPVAGEDAANAAWLLAQHADSDPAFQRQCLDLLTVAASQGEATTKLADTPLRWHAQRPGLRPVRSAFKTSPQRCWPTWRPRSTSCPVAGWSLASGPAGTSSSPAPTASRWAHPGSAATGSRRPAKCSPGCSHRRRPRPALDFTGGTPGQFSRARDVLHQHCADAGRDPARILLSSQVPFTGDQAETTATAADSGAAGAEVVIIYRRPPYTPAVLER